MVALRAEVQDVTPEVVDLDDKVYFETQSESDTFDHIDAGVQCLVVDVHKMTVRWSQLTMKNRGGLVQRKNIRSCDRGGNERKTHRESPHSTTQAKNAIEPNTHLNLLVKDTC